MLQKDYSFFHVPDDENKIYLVVLGLEDFGKSNTVEESSEFLRLLKRNSQISCFEVVKPQPGKAFTHPYIVIGRKARVPWERIVLEVQKIYREAFQKE